MSSSINGVQLGNKFGADMRTQFMDQGINNLPNPESGAATSLPQNPLYNLLQVVFQGKKTDNISAFNQDDTFIKNGLVQNFTEENHNLNLIG